MKYLICMTLVFLPLMAMANNEADTLKALGVGTTPPPTIPSATVPTKSVPLTAAPATSASATVVPAIDPAKAKEILEQLTKQQQAMEAQTKYLEELDAEE